MIPAAPGAYRRTTVSHPGIRARSASQCGIGKSGFRLRSVRNASSSAFISAAAPRQWSLAASLPNAVFAMTKNSADITARFGPGTKYRSSPCGRIGIP